MIPDFLNQDNLILGLAAYGAYKVAVSPALSLLGGIYSHFLRPRRNFRERYGDNAWAMITGSTDGIGKAFAEILAEEGFNIIIVGRSPGKLEKTKNEMEEKYKERKFEIRCLDLNTPDVQKYIDLGDSVAHLDIAILVNNAGVGDISPFYEEEYQEVEKLININIAHGVYLTRNLLPRMLLREKRSAVIFTTAFCANYPHPGLATYSATKRFNDHFAQCLAYENPSKIDFLSFKPSLVKTGMNTFEVSFSVLSPRMAVNSILDKLGYQISSEGSWHHIVFNAPLKGMLTWLPKRFVYSLMFRKIKEFGELVKEWKKKKEAQTDEQIKN